LANNDKRSGFKMDDDKREIRKEAMDFVKEN
jgi:hypothetical protein